MATRLTIIGAGPGGYVAAIRAARAGAQVTVIEDREVGGACLHAGCIPTKTLLATAEMLERIRNAADFGVETGAARYNLERVRERKDKVIATQVKGIRALFKSWGVTCITGRGSLLSEDAVRLVQSDGTTQDILSDKIIIATGSRPAALPGITPDGQTILTSDDAVQMKRVPKSILIIGAGAIGCEFAFIYRAFGADVTVVELMSHALPAADAEISEIIEREMKKAKIMLQVGERIERVERTGDGTTTTLASGKTIAAEQVLLSIGRKQNTDGLDLEYTGIATGKRGEITVNERMETSVPGVFAVGDVTGKLLLAHVASRQGIVAAENATGGDARMDYRVVPAGVFTLPEVGSVGITEREAEQQGIHVRIGRFPYRALGKAHSMGELAGMVKVIADAGTDIVLGVHICGAHATDLVHEAACAMHLGARAADIGRMIHAHPTLAEAVMEAAEDVHAAAIHLPKRSGA